jgi:hypothetical protein
MTFLLFMDETDRTDDKRFIDRMSSYFTGTEKGRERSRHIMPVPFFVASEMNVGVQAADIVLYCINNGFRLARGQENTGTRADIQERYEKRLAHLQWMGSVDTRDAGWVNSQGIVHIPDPFTSRPRHPAGRPRNGSQT